ncbi:MAG: efflux RND transporter permease subunit, partial [Limisphaerales bacterium]
ADDIRHAVISETNGVPVTVGDIAELVQAPTPRRGSVGYNLEPEVIEGFALMRRGENPSRVLDGLHKKVEELNKSILPEGMKIEVFYDRTNLVSHTLSTVHHNLLHGFLLVVVIVWIFLRSVEGSAIVAIVIPLSLIVSFIGLSMLGLPANLISMGAIDFGILVDGAVVLVEHVLHSIRVEKPQDRKSVLKLVIKSALDAGQPTFYAMLIIIAALLPVFTLQSVEGRIFRPLALTYAFALLGALVFAITFVPAMCALVFKPKHSEHKDPRWLGRLCARYNRALSGTLRRRPIVIVLSLILLVGGGFAISRLGTEFLPELDEGDFVIFVEMPASIAMEKGKELLVEVRRRLLTFPEVKETLSEHGRPEDGTDNQGVNMSETFVRLLPREKWRKGLDKDKLVDEMRQSLTQIPGVRFNFSQPIKDNVEEAVSGVRGKVVLKIFGTDLKVMRDSLESCRDVLKNVKGVTDLDLYRDALVPQLQIKPNRRMIARYGLSMDDVQQTIGTALAGSVATEFWERERPVPVRVTLTPRAHEDINLISALPLHCPNGATVALKDIADIQVASGVATISREGNSRFLALKFNVEGRDMGSVVKDAVATVTAKVKAPPGHYFVWGGEFENQERAIRRLKLIVPVAILLVLGLLYAAMGNGRSALAIIATAPFAMTGGAFALLIAGIPLSVSAVIGFIALLGQVSLMGVLVLGTTEKMRRKGLPLMRALADGAAERLRPVLMASLLALFGLLPMATATGVGSETQRPFALVVVGGMFTTLLVSLFFLPTLYSYLTTKELITPEEADA